MPLSSKFLPESTGKKIVKIGTSTIADFLKPTLYSHASDSCSLSNTMSST